MLRNPFRNLDHKNLSRSSESLKTQNDYFKIVNKRIVIFTGIIVFLFGAVVVRLFFVQIRGQENYQTKLENYSLIKESQLPPRGLMVDRQGKEVAKTVSAHNITYYPPENVTNEQEWELAQKFAKQFKVNKHAMTLSDYQDMYMFLHVDKNGDKDYGNSLLKENELQIAMAEQEKLKRSRITKEMVEEMTTEAQRNAFSIYLAMNKTPDSKTKIILEDVADSEVAYLMEHKSEYRGYDVDFSSWKREYPYNNTFRDVLGNVTTNKQGVPSELASYYEAKGYSLTDRVGASGLEKQYEYLLSGERKVSEMQYDEEGIAVLNEITSGKKGYDLHLTIDIELQKKVDEILNKVLKNASSDARRSKFDQAYVILMNPNTGEIYSMSGVKKLSKDTIVNFASGNYKIPYEPGSIVKAATSYMGLNEKVITRNTIINDAPMYIKGTATKRSFADYGPLNIIGALQKSSNVYMFNVALLLAGSEYVPNEALNIPDLQKTIDLMRSYYSSFGLGTITGLDIPDELPGQTPNTVEAGKLLDFAIGQFDTYTPIQIAQYISTIANGGKKIAPKLVNTATEVNSNQVIFENKTNVLSTLKGSQKDLDIVKEGMRECVSTGFCGIGIRDLPVEVAAKTGTAERGDITNASLIGFAPYKAPELAFVCSAPNSDVNSQNLAGNVCYQDIMPEVLKEFFKKY